MNKAEKTQYIIDLERELEQKHVYELFERLTRELIVHQPSNPIEFLIEKLKHPEGKRIFIVGPPGSNVRELTLQLSDHFEAKVVSVGDLLKKEVSKKTDIGQTIDEYMKNMLYTPDDQVVKILVSHLSTLDKTQNVIIEGFPKTLYQSMAIVKAKVIPDLLVVVNYPESDCQTFLKRKFTEHDSEQWAELSESERKSRGKEYLVQYNLNIRELKHSYKNNLIEIDGSKQTVLNDLARLIKFKIKPKTPKRSYRVLILGRSGSGRTTIMRALCEKLGFVPISTAELLVDMVRNKTELGQRIYEDLANNKLISDEIVSGIVKGRINRADCKLHGFVLEGFPKTEVQVGLMDEIKLEPNFVISIECSSDLAKERIVKRYEAQGKKVTAEEMQSIEERVRRTNSTLKALKEKFESQIITVQATDSPNQIIENIIHAMEQGSANN